MAAQLNAGWVGQADQVADGVARDDGGQLTDEFGRAAAGEPVDDRTGVAAHGGLDGPYCLDGHHLLHEVAPVGVLGRVILDGGQPHRLPGQGDAAGGGERLPVACSPTQLGVRAQRVEATMGIATQDRTALPVQLGVDPADPFGRRLVGVKVGLIHLHVTSVRR